MDIQLTEAAALAAKTFIDHENAASPEQPPIIGIRLKVLPGGCSGFQYAMHAEDVIQDGDAVVESHGVTVIVNAFSQQYLNGVVIDYVKTLMGEGYTFCNPNASGSCGCGSSFNV